MKVSGRGITATATATETSKAKGKPAEEMQKPADMNKDLKASADRFAKANNGRFGQISKPGNGAGSPRPEAKPDDVDLQAKVPEGSMPGGANVEQGSHAAAIDDTIAGPQQGYSTNESLREQAHDGLGVDRDLLGQGSQTDGRNPNEDYRGGADLGIGNPYSGIDRSAAGKMGAAELAGLKALDASTKAAAAAGDYDKVSANASAVSSGLGKGPGTETVTPSPGLADRFVSWVKEKLTDTASGKDQTGGTETATESQAQAAEDSINESAGTEKTKLGTKGRSEQANEAAEEVGVQADGATTFVNVVAGKTPKGKETTEDRGADSEGGPFLHQDFVDQYQGIKLDAIQNSDVNPGDQVQGSPSEFNPVDSEQYTSNYGEGHTTPSKADIEAGKKRVEDAAGNDEEF